MIPVLSNSSPLPGWRAIAEAAAALGVQVEVMLDAPVRARSALVFGQEGGPARLWVLTGEQWSLLGPLLANHAEVGLGGRLLVIVGPSPWLGRLSFPVFVPDSHAAGGRLVGEALALSCEFTTPVCLALPAVPGGNGPAVEQDVWQAWEGAAAPVVAEARAVALANHVEMLGAWCLHRGSDRNLGVIAAGASWHYVRRVYPEARCLRLDLAWPLPLKTIKGVVAVSRQTCWVPGGADWGAEALAEEGVVLATWPPEACLAREKKSPGKVG